MAIDKNLIQRSLAGIVFLAVMVFGICYSSVSQSILFALISILGAYELTGLLATRLNANKYKLLTAGLLALPAVLFPILQHFPSVDGFLPVAIILCPFISVVLLFLLPHAIEKRLATAGIYSFTYGYVIISFLLFSMVTRDRELQYYYFPLIYLFILVWANDTMAYVCGRLLGRHKLAPAISPKKTWEGFIGGILFTILASWIAFKSFGIPVKDSYFIWLAPVVISVFATIGDLFESAIKRWAGVKDSGNIIPGHGGILDRFDGAIFAIWPYLLMVYMVK